MFCRPLIFLLIVYYAAVNGRKTNFFQIGQPLVDPETPVPPDEWFDQDLDHFNPSDSRKWKQRYFTNSKFFENDEKPVVFLMIGGEGEASADWMVAGQWIDYAEKFNALCFQVEHRFYGKSHPTEDLAVKNLAYLNSEQALADLANFITWINDKYKFDSQVKWIVFGGSYPGSLAAWMRLKYPHLVHGAVSSSGPLLAKADFMEYYSVVVSALRTSSDECVDAVKSGIEQITVLRKHMIGQQRINKLFRVCDSITDASKLDISNFYESIAGNFAGVVQYNKDNRIGKSAHLSNITIDLVCRLMTDTAAGNPIERLANVNSVLLSVNNQTCLDYKYQNMINDYKNVSWEGSSAEGGRQWMFQTCNEFGFYQTSGGEPEIFSNEFPLSFYTQQCSDIFGAKFNLNHLDDGIRRSNFMYGALNIEVNQVVFVHGSIDPWHILGITKTMDNDASAIYIEGTAHCANMYPARDEDLPHLKAARIRVGELIGTWLEK